MSDQEFMLREVNALWLSLKLTHIASSKKPWWESLPAEEDRRRAMELIPKAYAGIFK